MIDIGRDYEQLRDYLDGRLPEAEHRAFEDRLVRDPALVSELEGALQLKEGFGQLQAEGYFSQSALPTLPARPRWLAQAAAAAAAVVAVALSLWVYRLATTPQILRPSLARVSADSVKAQFTFVTLRGSAAPKLTLPQAGLIEFRAKPEGAPSLPRYRITLLRVEPFAAEVSVASLADLLPAADGYLHVYADAARLEPGDYSLRVESGDTGATAPQSFHFTFTRRSRSRT